MQRLTLRVGLFLCQGRCFLGKKKVYFVYLFALILLFIISNVYIEKIISLPNEFYASYEEVEEINHKNQFGRLVKAELKEKGVLTGSNEQMKGEIVFKLFGFLPIKKTEVNLLPEEEVYIGGSPIGLAMKTDGAVIVSNAMVSADKSQILKNQYLQNGDVIVSVDKQPVHNSYDLVSAIENVQNEVVNVGVLSGESKKNIEIPLIKDEDGNYKLGVWVKDGYSGVGTLTFVRKSDKSFGALGHPITNGVSESPLPIDVGEIYSCSLVDIAKGERNKPGELRGVFVKKNKQGDFYKNTEVGIFGKLCDYENLYDQNRCAKLGGRLSVKAGKAKLLSSISGILEEYDIEIIKANYQAKSASKSMVVRVVDSRLLSLTGGIVQGMSGSPIIQDGKIVGAVTHVFLADPTKGYAVYSDWMLENI